MSTKIGYENKTFNVKYSRPPSDHGFLLNNEGLMESLRKSISFSPGSAYMTNFSSKNLK